MKNITKKIQKWINRSFRQRIAVFLIPMILTFIFVVSAVSYYVYDSSILREMKKNISGTVEQGNYTVDLYFQDVKTTIVQLTDNDSLLYMLQNYDKMSPIEKYYKQIEIDEALMNTSLIRDHISDCIIVGLNGYQTNMPDRQNLRYNRKILEEEWMQTYLEEDKKFFFTPSHLADYYPNNIEKKQVLSVILPVEPYGKRLGYIIVDMDFGRMNEIISARSDMGDLRYLIINETGQIIFSDDCEKINKKLPAHALQNMKKSNNFYFKDRNKNYFCVHEKSITTGWELLGLIPEDNIKKPAIQLLKLLCFSILPCFMLIAIFAATAISGRIRKPLDELVEQMKKVDIEEPKNFHVENSIGEIENLAQKITEMIERINNLVEQVYVAEMRSKDAQIEALISQIQPHFLYNTLQLIKTEAALGESRNVAETVNYLSRFLRYTVNNQEFYVSLEQELEYVRCYMEICKKRFPGKMNMEFTIGEKEMKYQIPKLILQPLIENSVKYGLRPKGEKGIIRILADVEEDESLLLCVEDNGVGMEQEKMGELLENIRNNKGKEHVGLRNVHERCVLYGDDSCGIQKIESKYLQYFRIYIRVKKGGEIHV